MVNFGDQPPAGLPRAENLQITRDLRIEAVVSETDF
jgi:hypothetical protein